MEEGDTETIALLAKLLEIDELRQVRGGLFVGVVLVGVVVVDVGHPAVAGCCYCCCCCR